MKPVHAIQIVALVAGIIGYAISALRNGWERAPSSALWLRACSMRRGKPQGSSDRTRRKEGDEYLCCATPKLAGVLRHGRGSFGNADRIALCVPEPESGETQR